VGKLSHSQKKFELQTEKLELHQEIERTRAEMYSNSWAFVYFFYSFIYSEE
jgi:hypothetical protein